MCAVLHSLRIVRDIRVSLVDGGKQIKAKQSKTKGPHRSGPCKSLGSRGRALSVAEIDHRALS